MSRPASPSSPDPVSMLERLVAFPTVSRDSNRALIDFVAEFLAGHGVESRIVPNEDGSKANLYATVGPRAPGGVVLSGHTDVVPVDGQPWDTDPFVLTERDGRLHGRGSCDMKGFIATALALVPEMCRRRLVRPIHLAFSYDEEVGCTGAPAMIERMARELPGVRAVVVGEPTLMRVVNAHKGMHGFETVVIGHEAHSSQTHRGVSAVMNAARLVTWLDDRARTLAASPRPETGFEPPWTTIHVGVIEGGTAMNIISRQCRFRWDVRNLPGDDVEALLEEFEGVCEARLEEMRAVAPEADIRTTRLFSAPGLRPEEDGAAEALARLLTGENATGVVSYGTEAGEFQEAGFSTIVCGPGSIDQAHQPNEYIERRELERCEAVLRRLIDLQSGSA